MFKKYLAQTSPEPMMFEPVRAEGCWFYDRNGKKYLDLISGISVSALGHCHPAVVMAVQHQSRTMMHAMVYGEFILSPQLLLARKILETLDAGLDNVYFVNSGSEAVEGAIKLAYKYTGKRELISCYNAYHGSSTGALSLMSDTYYSEGYKPLLSNVNHIHFNKVADLEKISTSTAAVFVEPIQGEAGYLPAEQKFLRALREKCTATGALLVFDEIQSGMGRTGKFWAHHHYDVVPDILLSAKGLGGGLPLGAFISSQKIMATLSDQPILGHITTFGGNPVCCAASLATVQEILEGCLLDAVPDKEQLFRSQLSKFGIERITGKGLMLGIPTRSFEHSKKVVQTCLNAGLITDWFLYETNKLRISPPLNISKDEIIFACEVIGNALTGDIDKVFTTA